ncbi:MAG: hypothetical protein HIU83_04605 [Proteobacteria bacterium]|nr:hypothetical protein [Pseudomonadota bacterium]
MKKQVSVILCIISVGIIAGCGGGSDGGSGVIPTSNTISGKVADGYLSGAEVFLDKNGNYQWDSGEPKTTTDGNGAYNMTASAADAAMYPMVVHAIAGVTIDKDTNTAVTNSYVLCAPAGSTGFISPMSTLVWEKMHANPGMHLNDATTQLRNQMNLPAGFDMMSDYVAGSQSGVNATHHQEMHTIAQQMVDLIAGQSALVMPGGNVNANRYHDMMGIINANMSGIAANTEHHLDEHSTFMTTMMTSMHDHLGSISTSGSFINYSSTFRNMTSSRYFWNNTSGTTTPITPMGGGMM